jgi:hypothetical protein
VNWLKENVPLLIWLGGIPAFAGLGWLYGPAASLPQHLTCAALAVTAWNLLFTAFNVVRTLVIVEGVRRLRRP